MNTDSEYAKKNYNVEITFKVFFFSFYKTLYGDVMDIR